MLVDALAVSFVVAPLTLVHVSVGMNEPALAIGLIVAPVAYVLTAIFPGLCATAIAVALLGPLSLEGSPVIKQNCVFLHVARGIGMLHVE